MVQKLFLRACALGLLHSIVLAWQHPVSGLVTLGVVVATIVLFFQGLIHSPKTFSNLVWWYMVSLCASHGSWVLVFCLQHTTFGPIVSWLIYSCSVFFTATLLSIATMFFMLFAKYVHRLAFAVVWYGLLHMYLCYAGLWFVGLDHGYPFANPLLPLTRSQTGCSLLSTGARIAGVHQLPVPAVMPLFLKPVREKDRQDPLSAMARLVRQLTVLPIKEDRIIVSPEGCFPFALNDYPSLRDWITGAFAKKDLVLLGSYWHEHDTWTQVIVPITREGLGDPYHKRHLIGGFERIPAALYWCKSLGAWWQQKIEGWHGVLQQHMVDSFVLPQLTIVPCVCSELFLDNGCALSERMCLHAAKNRPVVGLIAVHDGRFMPYMQRLCKDYAQWYACTRQVPLWYVAWDGCWCLTP